MEESEDEMALFKRSAKPDEEDEEDMVSFDDDAYAWWAHREQLEHKFVPKHSDPVDLSAPEDHERHSDFADQYPTEALFNWATSSEPDEPTHGGRGTPLDPYGVLGLQPGTSLEEVVVAHRNLAKKYHPDRFYSASAEDQHDAAEHMSLINAAYQELRKRLTTHRHRV